MAQYVLADSSDDIAESAAEIFTIRNRNDREYILCQCSVASAGTASIRGRTSENMPWVEMTSFTADGITKIAAVSQMICVLSGVSGGAVRVEVAD